MSRRKNTEPNKVLRLSPINTNTSCAKKAVNNKSETSPPNKKKLASINQDLIDRLSRPKKKKNRPKHFVQPSSATGRWSTPGGGRFSTAKPKSDIEIKMLRAAKTPGPGQYQLPQFGSGNSGIRISDANPLSEIDLKMIRAAETPGPNQYNTQHDYSKLNGGRFSTANPKSDLEWTMHNAKETPGPNEYDISLCPPPHISPIR